MKITTNSRARRQSGYSALFITLVLVGATVMMLGATLSRSTSGSRLNDRNCTYLAANGAAEAAVEKVLAYMIVDFDNNGEGQVQSNLNMYETTLLPSAAENPYWNNYTFSDGQGNNGQIYVARTTTVANAPYIALEEQFSGLSGYASTYRILANVTVNSSTYNYSFTNAVQQDVELAQIPVFQFAIFYNGLLEFSDTATLNVSGPVHANSNIYVGSPDALTFNSMVTSTGNITSPANAGYSANSWTGKVSYNGSPSPGYLTGQPSLTLPIGTTSTSGTNVQQILYPPPTNALGVLAEAYNSPMGQQRYFWKADLVIQIFANNTFSAAFKSAPNDPFPAVYTNYLSVLTNNSWLTNKAITLNSSYGTNWGYNWQWLSTTNVFYDWREKKTVDVTQIDVALLTNWMNTWLASTYNTNGVAAKFTTANPFNIIYVCDWRASNNASTLSAVRLVHGAGLPATGLTVATPNPMYIQGIYNCPNSIGLNSTNTTQSMPASVACDALTILSPAWTDGAKATTTGSWNELGTFATSDTVDCAIIAGIVPSTGTSSSTYSGGVNNLPRLLEDWGSAELTLNTSIVCLYSSTWATGVFVLPGTYYNPPSVRNFSFNQNYTQSTGMPPGTPNICRLVRAAWCNPPPGTVTYAPSPTLDFVSQ